MSRPLYFAVASLIATPFIHAQTEEATNPRLETVVVIAHPLSAEGLALSAEVLEGEELARSLQSSIGETVGQVPGVHSASFGQAASRPVIHGLAGPRVRVMEDRVDTLDVSVTSADHAVTIEPFLADRIEILKGPSTLLYGSGAIGGVVDVHTGRIPHDRAEKPLSGNAEVRRDDNGDRETAALRLDGGGGLIAWHLDGFWRDADEYEIPGFAESRALRAREDEDQDDHDDAVRGRLPGSQLEARGGAFGLSFIGGRGFFGASVGRYEAEYGLPGGHEPGHEEEEHDDEGTPIVDLKQSRFDVEAGVTDPLRGFEALNVRVAVNRYEHEEVEPDGEVATEFENDAYEVRMEMVHGEAAGWRGAVGVQYTDREFSAIGEEAFIAPVDTRSLGAFWVGERSLTNFDLEAGLRLERVEVDPSTGSRRRFTSYAASLGLVIPVESAWSIGLLTDVSARAPIAEELFSDGPHLATGAFEIGNPDLDEEKALSLSANVRYTDDKWFFNGTVYYTRFADYIFESPTGGEEDGLPVFVYRQEDADFFGLDAELRRAVAVWDRGRLELGVKFDTVTASLDVSGNDDLPRMPPTRYGIGMNAQWGPLRASVDYLRVRSQSNVADFELPTDRYEDLRAYLGADLDVGNATMTVFVQGRNLTDDEQRQHTSFIKDLAPLPGRTLEAGIRARF